MKPSANTTPPPGAWCKLVLGSWVGQKVLLLVLHATSLTIMCQGVLAIYQEEGVKSFRKNHQIITRNRWENTSTLRSEAQTVDILFSPLLSPSLQWQKWQNCGGRPFGKGTEIIKPFGWQMGRCLGWTLWKTIEMVNSLDPWETLRRV